MDIDVRRELSQLASARHHLLELVAVAERDPGDALVRLRTWREDLVDLADVDGELGGLVALSATLEHLLAWGAAVRAAEADAARHLTAAKAEAAVQAGQLASGGEYDRAAATFLSAARDLERYEELQHAADLFAATPVRTSLTHKKSQRQSRTRNSNEEREGPPPLIDLTVKVDGEPWLGPRLLRLNHGHQVTLTASLSRRPRGLRSVSVTALGTIGFDVLSWPPEITFAADDFAPAASRTFTIVGRATTDFRAGNEVRLSAELEAEDGKRHVRTIGLRTLQPVITDQTFATMGTGTVPLQLVEVFRDVEGRGVRSDAEHWTDFEHALRAVLEFQLSTLAGGEYRDTTSYPEKSFQVDLRRFLHARLGVDNVFEGEKAGGGEFDLRYRTVPIELKVETDTSDLDAIARKYGAQASQYPAARGRQLSLLAVLDVTRSRELTNVANYIQVIERYPGATGDLEKSVPLITVLVVIPANYPRPSDLS